MARLISISALIYSMRAYKQGYVPLIFENSNELDAGIFEQFEEELTRLLADIIDPETHFEHNSKSDYCQFCT